MSIACAAEVRTGLRTPFAVVLAVIGPLGLGAPALAQNFAQKDSSPLDAVKQRDQELEAVRSGQKKATESAEKLRAEIDTLGEERRKFNRALIDMAANIRNIETRITETEARLSQSADKEAVIRKSLDGRRAVIAEVLAALQRIGRRPPPAIMVKAEDALETVHTAILLGAVLPDMRGEAQALSTDLADLVRVRADATTQRDALARDLAALSTDKQRMSALIDQRQQRQSEAEKELAAERERAAQLSRQADSLKELITKLEEGLDSAARAARAASRATESLSAARPNLSVLKDPGRLTPAVSFAAAKGVLPLPVNGVKIKDFGAGDDSGSTEKGVSIATRGGAQVTAPCDGWVVYAAPYRSYGQLLILNAGGGYHVLLAGMDRISVDLGQFVLTGEPVAVMGNGPQVASTIAPGIGRSNQPVLYIEFRKDGTPVDPAPWWATNDNEKVRG